MAIQRLINLLVLTFCSTTFAKNLRPRDLTVKLEKLDVLRHQNSVIPFIVSIKNETFHNANILIPVGQNTGKSLFQLRVFKVEGDDDYNLVYTSIDQLNMDTTNYRLDGSFYYLKAQEKFTMPIFVNDIKNVKVRFESGLTLPDLAPGRYAFQVLYTPENSKYFNYAFRTDIKGDPIPVDDVPADQYHEHLFWEGSYASNIIELDIKMPGTINNPPPSSISKLCDCIVQENWKKVLKLWDNELERGIHNCILWKYDPNGEVVASLPSYTSYEAIFLTKSGIKYVRFSYQVGRINGTRRRMARLFYAFGGRRPPFSTSDPDWTGLIRVTSLN